jgi:predicted metal-binding membrane protein
MVDSALESALRRDRWLVGSALLVVTAMALGYTAWLATGFDMSGMMSPVYVPWSARYFVFMLVMWVVMMIGMMTPSVAPTILLYAAFGRRSAQQGDVFASAAWFAAGYLLAWSAFALAATLLQWLLEKWALVTPMMAGTSRTLGGCTLICAGIYQWLPAKQACLSHCRAPLSFIQAHGGFRPGVWPPVRLGILHGGYCIGCCWMLMFLLFAFGVMNLAWIGGLMMFVLLEKLVPAAGWIARTAGVLAIIAGFALIVVDRGAGLAG